MNVQGLMNRIAKLEAARRPRPSPFVVGYGSFEAFAAKCRAEMDAGALDRDFPLDALAKWETDGTWQGIR